MPRKDNLCRGGALVPGESNCVWGGLFVPNKYGLCPGSVTCFKG